MSHTNAWVTLRESLAQAWWSWYQWLLSDQQGPEPALSNWDKNAIRKLVDIEFAFRAYKKADLLGDQWRLLSVWGVTESQVEAGYAQHGDAASGGDYGVIGFWSWSNRADDYCPINPKYPWKPNQVIAYMPDECVDVDCTSTQPARYVWDVNLGAGQPPRELPPAVNGIDLQQLTASLISEGWDARYKGSRVDVHYNGHVYGLNRRTLYRCEFSDLPTAFVNDLMDALQVQGYVCA